MNDAIPMLVFRLSDQYYGIHIDHVVEVAAMVEFSALPDATPELLGMVNRHGAVLPLIDLRQAFGLGTLDINLSTLFIVVSLDKMRAGLVVDEVFQVQYIQEATIQVAHAVGRKITHIASDGQRLYQIIDPQAVLATYLTDVQT